MDVSYFQQVFQRSPNAYIVFSPDLFLIDINQANLILNGYKREQVIGRHLFDVFPALSDEQKRQLKDSFDRVIAENIENTMPLLHYPIANNWTENRQWEDRELQILRY